MSADPPTGVRLFRMLLKQDPDVVYQYVRHRRGNGASDDTAIIAGGLLWSFGVGMGLFLADAIDTFEKYVTEPANED